jgi:hypothetical protein
MPHKNFVDMRQRSSRWQPGDPTQFNIEWDSEHIALRSTTFVTFDSSQPKYSKSKPDTKCPVAQITRAIRPPPCLNPAFWKRFDLTMEDITKICRDTMVPTAMEKYQLLFAMQPVVSTHAVCPSAIQPNLYTQKFNYASCAAFMTAMLEHAEKVLKWKPANKGTKLAHSLTWRHATPPLITVDEKQFEELQGAKPEKPFSIRKVNKVSQTFEFKGTKMVVVDGRLSSEPKYLYLERVVTLKDWNSIGTELHPDKVPATAPILIDIDGIVHVLLYEGCAMTTANRVDAMKKKSKKTRKSAH